MRISDWSSDVCSSDRPQAFGVGAGLAQRVQHRQGVYAFAQVSARDLAGLVGIAVDVNDVIGDLKRRPDDAAEAGQPLDLLLAGAGEGGTETTRGGDQAGRLLVDHLEVMLDLRSEEHTSELQSLMRISYAVFCLKKKKTKNND